MAWEVEFSDEFEAWWLEPDEDEQESIAASVGLLEERGPTLDYPHSSDMKQSRHGRMRELRVQHRWRPIRVFYAWEESELALIPRPENHATAAAAVCRNRRRPGCSACRPVCSSSIGSESYVRG